MEYPINPVFEVCDTTDDERNYVLGIFPTLFHAREAIEKCIQKKEKVSDHSEEYEKITVFSRNFGWTENGNVVWELELEEYYDEASDEYLWRKKEAA